MASFNTPIVTTQGLTLLKSAIAGAETLTFTKLIFSADDYTNSTDTQVSQLTDISSKDMVTTPQSFTDANGNVKVRAVGYNQSTSQAFNIKTYALYATNKEGDELLFAVSTSQTADFVPAYNGKQLNQVAYTFNFSVSSSNNITFSDTHDIAVTQADLANINAEIQAVQNGLAHIDLSGAVNQAKSYTDNSVNSLSAQLVSSVATNTNAINTLQSSVNANSSAIASNSTSLANNIASNSNAIASNSNSIASNSANINSLASTTSSAIGSLYSTAISSNESISGIKNYENGIQIAGNSVYVQNQKLMYENKPVLIANAPNAPTISLSIDPNTANVQYQITPPSVDGGASITSYTLYYKNDSDSDFTSVKLDKDNLIGQINSVSGANYQFKVSATNYAGDGFTSNIQSILSAIAPSNVSITIDNQYPNGIHYHITTGNNGGANVSGYQIYYKAVNDTNWQMFQSTQNDGYIASAVTGTNYMVKAKSQNVVGLSSDSNVANINYVDNQIYGVSWNQSSSPTLTRTDSAVGMVAGINGSRNDFDNTELWGGMQRVTDSYGNVFVRIPKFYIKKTQSSGLSTWQVSLIKRDSSWYLPKCFYNFTTNNEIPYVDVGAYLADININLLESKTGKIPSNGCTIDQFRQYAKNNGNGYQQLDIHVWDVLQTLFTVEFATLDSQSVMYGNSINLNSGYTDNMNGSSAGDSNNIKYRGIESMYCNMFQYIDGIGINRTNIYVCNDANNYANSQFSYPYQQVGYNLPANTGYIQNIGLDLNNPEVSLPGTTTGNLGYFSDDCYNDSGSNYQMVAGGSGSASYYGLWCAVVSLSFGYTFSGYGARLIRKAVS